MAQLSDNKQHVRTANLPSNGTKLTFKVKMFVVYLFFVKLKIRASGSLYCNCICFLRTASGECPIIFKIFRF